MADTVIELAVTDEVVDVVEELVTKLTVVVVTALNVMLVKPFFFFKSLEWLLDTKDAKYPVHQDLTYLSVNLTKIVFIHTMVIQLIPAIELLMA